MKYSVPPFNEKPKRGFLEQKIFEFSEELFRTPILDITLKKEQKKLKLVLTKLQ